VVELEYCSLQPNAHLSPTLALYNEQGILIFTSGPAHDLEAHKHSAPAGLYRYICQVPGDLLNDGTHRLVLYIGRNERTLLQQNDILIFDVRDTTEMRHGWHGKWAGAVRPMLDWSKELVRAGSPSAMRAED